MSILLSRKDFREAVFNRDGGICVFCDKKGQDAHHILERRLWPDGGYYLDNGATVCSEHHIECEKTLITVENVRQACGIKNKIIPPHLYSDQIYDKWGNPVMENNKRLKGELFNDESVQKILKIAGVLPLFYHYVKYPRTYHLPWSESVTDDDRMGSINVFFDKEVVVTEKMDGENCNMYCDHIHARSLDSAHHPSQGWVKNLWSNICYLIPEGWRVCGENLYAEHSIAYKNLPTFFMVFSIWNENNVCLSWEDTCDWAELLGLQTVPCLYRGVYNEKDIKALWNDNMAESVEGYVVRMANEFHYKDFKNSALKYVRKNHIQHRKHC